MNQGREDEALAVLSRARGMPPDSEVVQIEFLYVEVFSNRLLKMFISCREIKAQHLFEVETSKINFPQYQDGSFKSNFMLGLAGYMSLVTSRSRPLFSLDLSFVLIWVSPPLPHGCWHLVRTVIVM